MRKRDFIELTGESPEDIFGPDWRNYLEDLEDDSTRKPERSYFLTKLHGTGLEKL